MAAGQHQAALRRLGDQRVGFFQGRGEGQASAVAQRLLEAGAQALCIVFLNSYANPANERAALAAVAGLSVFHLAHSFRAATGFSPLAYRNQRRVIAARQMLRDGGEIADVAAAVGYADQSHLTRHFQRIVGASPGRYAQQ
eukprot:gene40656-54975_t